MQAFYLYIRKRTYTILYTMCLQGLTLEILSHNDLLALNRVIGEVYTARDVESFYSAVFSAIQSIIPGELFSFNETSRHTTRFQKTIAASQDHNSVTKKLFPALNAFLHEHPLVPYFNSDVVFKTSDVMSINQFKCQAIYNEYYRHLDIETQMGLSIPLSQEKSSILALSRKGPDYSERDRLLLTLLKPHLINALKNVTELDCIRLERDLLHMSAEAQGQGTILFHSDGMIVCISSFAKELLARYFDMNPGEGEFLPQVLMQWFNTETRPPVNKRASARLSMSVERVPLTIVKEDKKLKIKLMKDFTTDDYILTMVETSNTLIMQNLQGYGLSSRESEVLLWLSKGKTNAEIAIILDMGKRTVEKHLERIFVKLGVATRAAAAAILSN